MEVGVVLRNMGPQSTRETLVAAARAADALPAIADLWVVDHIAIPPDDAEGSDGRYLDPLATLAYLAGVTTRVGLGTAVLVLPYRPALPTAKWIATVQELSGGRPSLGVGAGWMPIGLDPDALRPLAADLRAQAAATGRPAPEVAALTRLPLDDPGAARDLLARYAEAGATRVIHGERYADAAAFLAMLDRL